jgi:hypothetical protein
LVSAITVEAISLRAFSMRRPPGAVAQAAGGHAFTPLAATIGQPIL